MNKPPIFEAKHVSAFAKPEEIQSRYYPQLQHCMKVTGATKAYLSVFYGTLKHEVYVVEADPLYQAQLVAAERAFDGEAQARGEGVHLAGATGLERDQQLAGRKATTLGRVGHALRDHTASAPTRMGAMRGMGLLWVKS